MNARNTDELFCLILKKLQDECIDFDAELLTLRKLVLSEPLPIESFSSSLHSLNYLFGYLSNIVVSTSFADFDSKRALTLGQLLVYLQLIIDIYTTIDTETNVIKSEYGKNALKAINSQPGITQSELLKRVGGSKSNLSQYMSRPKTRKFIVCQHVGREVHYYLSRGGVDLLNKIVAVESKQNESKVRGSSNTWIIKDIFKSIELFNSLQLENQKGFTFFPYPPLDEIWNQNQNCNNILEEDTPELVGIENIPRR